MLSLLMSADNLNEICSRNKQHWTTNRGLELVQPRTEGQQCVDKRKLPITVPACLAVAYWQGYHIGVSLKQYQHPSEPQTQVADNQ